MQFVFYDKNERVLENFVFPMILHREIFDENISKEENPIEVERKKYRELRKIKDYYGTKFTFNKDRIQDLATEFREIGQYLDTQNKRELNKIIEKLVNNNAEYLVVVSD